eukprot:scaffold129276_cov36-Phaeocystis_antarctica.AAC.1
MVLCQMFNPRSKSRKFWVGPEILGCHEIGVRFRNTAGLPFSLKANFEPFRRGASGLVAGLLERRGSRCY